MNKVKNNSERKICMSKFFYIICLSIIIFIQIKSIQSVYAMEEDVFQKKIQTQKNHKHNVNLSLEYIELAILERILEIKLDIEKTQKIKNSKEQTLMLSKLEEREETPQIEWQQHLKMASLTACACCGKVCRAKSIFCVHKREQRFLSLNIDDLAHLAQLIDESPRSSLLVGFDNILLVLTSPLPNPLHYNRHFQAKIYTNELKKLEQNTITNTESTRRLIKTRPRCWHNDFLDLPDSLEEDDGNYDTQELNQPRIIFTINMQSHQTELESSSNTNGTIEDKEQHLTNSKLSLLSAPSRSNSQESFVNAPTESIKLKLTNLRKPKLFTSQRKSNDTSLSIVPNLISSNYKFSFKDCEDLTDLSDESNCAPSKSDSDIIYESKKSPMKNIKFSASNQKIEEHK